MKLVSAYQAYTFQAERTKMESTVKDMRAWHAYFYPDTGKNETKAEVNTTPGTRKAHKNASKAEL